MLANKQAIASKHSLSGLELLNFMVVLYVDNAFWNGWQMVEVDTTLLSWPPSTNRIFTIKPTKKEMNEACSRKAIGY